MDLELRSTSSEDSPTSGSSKSSETISMKNYDRLITELRCPGCASPMRTPILLCTTGHSICHRCTKILHLCPLCQEKFSTVRSLTLEALCAKAHFKCPNSSNGCKVRLPLKLLDWHEQHCSFKIMKCFMGKVWGNCNFSCRELDWKEHIQNQHSDKLFTNFPAELTWDVNSRLIPLAGYYVFYIDDEVFYLYQIYDKTNSRTMWSMTWASALRQTSTTQYAFEIQIYSPLDASKIICQRYPCHSEYERDILQEGSCVSVAMGDILRFVNCDKILSYRVQIHEIKRPAPRQITSSNDVRKILPLDFNTTAIEGVNHKSVPADIIVTRKQDPITPPPTPSENGNMELASSPTSTKDDSDSDPELESFVNQMVNSTPKVNFNRKFFVELPSDESASTSSLVSPCGDEQDEDELLRYNSVKYLNGGQKFNRMERITNSLKNFKTDFTELKSFGKKKKQAKSDEIRIKPIN